MNNNKCTFRESVGIYFLRIIAGTKTLLPKRHKKEKQFFNFLMKMNKMLIVFSNVQIAKMKSKY